MSAFAKASYQLFDESQDIESPDFFANPVMGPALLTVSVIDQSTGSIAFWEWNFGDGSANTTQNPSHTYTDPGTYIVSLTVTRPGRSDNETEANYIKVRSPAMTMPGIPLLIFDD